jgi:hypothetical protein
LEIGNSACSPILSRGRLAKTDSETNANIHNFYYVIYLPCLTQKV